MKICVSIHKCFHCEGFGLKIPRSLRNAGSAIAGLALLCAPVFYYT